LAQNWYDEERWIPYTDEDGEPAIERVVGPELIIPAKLTVVSGSTMPVSRIQQRDEAITLADKGHIDTEELLKKLEWEDRKNVLKRLQAGPIAAFLNKLSKLGTPQDLLQFFTELSQMDPKEMDRALKDGKIPLFPQLIQSMAGQQPGQVPSVAELDAQTKQAEARKIEADIRLVEAQIATEEAKQQEIMAGIEFDKEKMTVDRAKAVHEIDTGKRVEDREDRMHFTNEKREGVSGIKSDNRTPKK